MLGKMRIFKRLKGLEEEQLATRKAFGILISEINKFKKIQGKSEKSIPRSEKDMTPEEFMKWFISNP